MAWFTPFLVPALIGAGTSLLQRRDPLQGALIGGATGGLLSQIDFGSALNTLKDAASFDPSTVTAPTLGGLNMTGAGFQSALPNITNEAITSNISKVVPGSIESEGFVNVGGTYYPSGSISASGLIENPDVPDQFIDKVAYDRLNEPSFMDTVTGGLSEISPNTYAQAGLMAYNNLSKEQLTSFMQSVPVKPAKQSTIGKPLAVNIAQQRRKPVFFG